MICGECKKNIDKESFSSNQLCPTCENKVDKDGFIKDDPETKKGIWKEFDF